MSRQLSIRIDRNIPLGRRATNLGGGKHGAPYKGAPTYRPFEPRARPRARWTCLVCYQTTSKKRCPRCGLAEGWWACDHGSHFNPPSAERCRFQVPHLVGLHRCPGWRPNGHYINHKET